MSLTQLYGAWMDQLLPGPIPEETEATCDKCVMCPSKGEPQTPSPIRFNPRIKCCTYLPNLPNFLVGRILSSEDRSETKGRATVEARLTQGAAVTPLGTCLPNTHSPTTPGPCPGMSSCTAAVGEGGSGGKESSSRGARSSSAHCDGPM